MLDFNNKNEKIKEMPYEPGYFEKARKASDPEDNFKAISSEIKKVDDQISRLTDLYAMGSISFDILDGKIKDLNDKRRLLDDQLSGMKDQKKLQKKTKKLESTIKKIPDILDNGSFEDIRNLIEILVDKIVLDGDDIEFYWRF